MLETAIESGVHVFFPDARDRRSDYWAVKYREWARKDRLNADTRARAAGTHLRVVELACGFFLELIFTLKFYGFDHANNLYTIYRIPEQRISFTHELDLARTVAEVSRLVLNPAATASVPDIVRIVRSTVSPEEAAPLVEKVRGDGSKINIKCKDLAARTLSQTELTETEKANILLLPRCVCV